MISLSSSFLVREIPTLIKYLETPKETLTEESTLLLRNTIHHEKVLFIVRFQIKCELLQSRNF